MKMKKILTFGLTLALVLGVLAGCSKNNENASGSNAGSSASGTASGSTSTPTPAPAPAEKTAEELKALYTDAINNCGSEMVQYNPVISEVKEDDMSAMILESLGLTAEDMTAFGISMSMMNVKAYGIAAIMPAEGKEQAVKDALQNFIDIQKQSFEQYLVDQYEIAKNAKLETLADGTVLMVMCDGQDEAFESIKPAVEGK